MRVITDVSAAERADDKHALRVTVADVSLPGHPFTEYVFRTVRLNRLDSSSRVGIYTSDSDIRLTSRPNIADAFTFALNRPVEV